MPIDPRLMPTTPEGRNADRFASQRRAVEALQRGQVNTRQYVEDLSTVSLANGWNFTLGPELTIEVNTLGRWLRVWCMAQIRSTSTVAGTNSVRWATVHDSLDYPPGFTTGPQGTFEGITLAQDGGTFGPAGPTVENFIAPTFSAGGQPIMTGISSVEYPASVGTHRLFMSYNVAAGDINRQTRNRRIWAEVF